jgi:hypothetical protein
MTIVTIRLSVTADNLGMTLTTNANAFPNEKVMVKKMLKMKIEFKT